MTEFDVIIIGGGPGGAKAAQVLAAGGKTVAVVESTHLGGVCLNCGCIPTKMLLGAVAPAALLHGLERQRVARGQIEVDYTALQKRIQRYVKAASQTLGKGLTEAGVQIIQGQARCTGPQQVSVQPAEGQALELRAEHIILAGGSRASSFPGLEPDHDAVLDSTDLLAIPEIPSSLIIVGAGAIGLEMADFFRAMGTEVTIVEAAPQLAPTEDADLAQELQKLLTKGGLKCLTGVQARSLSSVAGKAVLTLADGQSFTADKALVAVGRKPNTDGLDAEKAGCRLNARGFVAVDARLRAAATVSAIGDINGQTLLAHAAEHQGTFVARQLLGLDSGQYDSGPMPSCIYGSLEVMRVGKTARQALAEGGRVEISRAMLMGNAIAQAGGDAAGFVKVVWQDARMVGMAALGHGVSHLVTAAQLVLLGQYHGERSHHFMFAHPTLDEAIAAAVQAPRTPCAP